MSNSSKNRNAARTGARENAAKCADVDISSVEKLAPGAAAILSFVAVLVLVAGWTSFRAELANFGISVHSVESDSFALSTVYIVYGLWVLGSVWWLFLVLMVIVWVLGAFAMYIARNAHFNRRVIILAWMFFYLVVVPGSFVLTDYVARSVAQQQVDLHLGRIDKTVEYPRIDIIFTKEAKETFGPEKFSQACLRKIFSDKKNVYLYNDTGDLTIPRSVYAVPLSNISWMTMSKDPKLGCK